MEGSGVYFSASGDQFEGTWVDDLKQGPGKIKQASGDVLSGSWTDSKMNGDFILSKADGLAYRLHFIDNMRQGEPEPLFEVKD